MATSNVDRIRREIEGLSASERQELLDWLRDDAGSNVRADEREQEHDFQSRMLREGFLVRRSTGSSQEEAEPLVIRGRSASESLIEDRELR